MKKGILLMGMIVAAVFPSSLLAANFSDVPDTHKNAPAIQTLKDAGIVSGYGDGAFKPDNPITRAESLAIILKAAGITAQKTAAKLKFTDVAETDWFFPMVQKGAALKKLKGYEDKTWRPNNPITLPEALALTLSFFNISTKGIAVDSVIYNGLNKKDWYAKYTQYAKDKNLIEPDQNGTVSATANLTRAAIAELVYRMRIIQQTGRPFDITARWITTEHQENFWKIKHPADWEIFKDQKNSVIWKRDKMQAFFTRVWPASARLSISLIDNTENLTVAQYFAKLKEAYQKSYPKLKPKFTDITLSGKSALQITIRERRIIDIAIYLPNKNFLVMYGEYGEAPIGEFRKKQIEAMIMSYQYAEKTPEPPKPVIPLEQRIETLRENILIADKWKEIAPLFPDKKLIHTDAIGVGTGPVDYYYSKEANQTMKLERDSGTVLNIREGETSAF